MSQGTNPKILFFPQLGRDMHSEICSFARGQWIVDSLPKWHREWQNRMTDVIQELQKQTSLLKENLQCFNERCYPHRVRRFGSSWILGFF